MLKGIKVMNDVQWGVIWRDIQKNECPTCKVMCQLKSLNINEMNTKRKQGSHSKKFQLIKRNKSCKNIKPLSLKNS